MSGTCEHEKEIVRDCLDFQLSLALERMERDGAGAIDRVSIPVPVGSILEKKITGLVEETPDRVNFEEAMSLCSEIEKEKKKETNMFFTLGIIIGFVLGWYVNDKWDWIKDRAVFWKK